MSSFGTELSAAYGPLHPTLQQQQQQQQQQQYAKPPPMPLPSPPRVEKAAETFQGRSFVDDQEPKQQQHNSSYVDELVMRRKEILKVLIPALAVMLGLSLHQLFSDYVVLPLANSTSLPTVRDFATKALYPLCILFAAWNLRVVGR
jgi:hypothetical protein